MNYLHRHYRLLAVTLTTSLLTVLTDLPAQAQVYDFNSGNDNGWTRSSPLGAYGSAGIFTFPSGGYRIDAPASPNDASYGPGRAASYPAETYAGFDASVEVTGWDANQSQIFGLLGRATQIGFGTTDGYLFGYMPNGSSPGFGAIVIQRIDNEQVTAVSELGDITLDPSRIYRLDFTASGSSLFGAVYDVTDPSNPLSTISTLDSLYASGYSGLFVSGVKGQAGSLGGVVFDNYAGSSP